MRLDDPAASSLFLFDKIEEEALGQTQLRGGLVPKPSAGARGLLAEGRARMVRASSEADNCSKISLSTLSIRVNRSSSYDLNLVGLDC